MELNQEENSNEEKVIAKSRKDNGNFSKWFIFALVFLTAAIFIKYGFSVFENTERDEMLQKGGFVENHIYKIFLMFDRNKDGLLEPLEFQSAYYDIQAKKNERLADGDLAFENTTVGVKRFLSFLLKIFVHDFIRRHGAQQKLHAFAIY